MSDRPGSGRDAVLKTARKVKRPVQTLHAYATHAGRAAALDLNNRIRFGPGAPRYAERVWFNPQACSDYVRGVRKQDTGQVWDGDWDLQRDYLGNNATYRSMVMRFEQGASWEETGIYDIYMDANRSRPPSKFRTLEEVMAIHQRYDRLFEQVQKERVLRTREQLGRGGFRAWDEVFVSFSRDMEPLFSGHGTHRLAAARIAGLETIPGLLGVVHGEAMTTWRTAIFRGQQ